MNKPIIASSVVALAIGFSLGWVLREPATADPNDPGNTPKSPQKAIIVKDERPPEEPNRTDRVTERRHTPPILTSNATPPESLQKAERAKWLRLIEVLGLDSDQAKALEATIAETRPKPDEDTPLDIAYSEAGEQLEQSILAILTQEQQAAFREMQQRSLENVVEVKAQEEFAESLTSLDLTAEQREQALEVLRKQAVENAATVPTSTRLLLGGSFLPIGDEKTTDKSFEIMGQLQSKPGEPLPTFEQIAALHRAELERRMTQFEGILSPGQLALYQSSLSQALENLEVISPQR
ncbi:MAG: hypothetical protein ACSHX9_15385 [Luteolibacter sp.]